MNLVHVFCHYRQHGAGDENSFSHQKMNRGVGGHKLIDGVVYKDGAGCLSMNNTGCMTFCIHYWQNNSQPKLYVEPDAGDNGRVSICTNCSHRLWPTKPRASVASTDEEA